MYLLSVWSTLVVSHWKSYEGKTQTLTTPGVHQLHEETENYNHQNTSVVLLILLCSLMCVISLIYTSVSTDSLWRYRQKHRKIHSENLQQPMLHITTKIKHVGCDLIPMCAILMNKISNNLLANICWHYHYSSWSDWARRDLISTGRNPRNQPEPGRLVCLAATLGPGNTE